MKLRRLFTYSKLKERSNRMKVLGDIAKKRAMLAYYIELGAKQFPELYNVNSNGLIVFEIDVDKYKDNDEFKKFESNLKLLCEMCSYEFKSGYSGFDTPSYFFCLFPTFQFSLDNMIKILNPEKYNASIKEYIKKYLN